MGTVLRGKNLDPSIYHNILWFSENPPCNSFRIRTCKSVSKQRTLTPFGMNTYEKTGGRGALLLTWHWTRAYGEPTPLLPFLGMLINWLPEVPIHV
jgi:hypothetical protein